MNHAKNLILIAPVSRWNITSQPHLPVSLVMLENYLFRYTSVHVDIVDAHVIGIPVNEEGETIVISQTVDRLVSKIFRNTLIGISAMSDDTIIAALMLANELRRRGIENSIVLGSYAATVSHRLILETWPHLIDAVVLGPGEEPLRQIVTQDYEDSRDIRWDEAPNVAYFEGNEVKTSSSSIPIPFSEMPVLDISRLPEAYSYDRISYSTTRGCPFNCAFCHERMVYPKYHKRTLEKIRKDAESILTYSNIHTWVLGDPMFGAGKSDTAAIIRFFASQKIRVHFGARVDVLSFDLYETFSGTVRSIFFGVEATHPASILRMRKAHSPEKYVEQAKRHILLANEHGVLPIVSCIMTYPGNTREEIDHFINFAEKLRTYGDFDKTGIFFRSYPYSISFGHPDFEKIPHYIADGMEIKETFPANVHRISIPAALQHYVKRSDPGLSAEHLVESWQQLHDLSQIDQVPGSELVTEFYGPNLKRIADDPGFAETYYPGGNRNIINSRKVWQDFSEGKLDDLLHNRDTFENPFLRP